MRQVTTVINALGERTDTRRNANGQATRITQPDPDGTGPLTAPVIDYEYDSPV